MFERFDVNARRTIFYARYEASGLGDTEIKSAHLLLGVARENRDLVSRVLGNEVNYESLQEMVAEIYGTRNPTPVSVDFPLAPACRIALDAAIARADQAEQNTISSKHLLYGLLQDGSDLPGRWIPDRAAALQRLDANLNL